MMQWGHFKDTASGEFEGRDLNDDRYGLMYLKSANYTKDNFVLGLNSYCS